MKFLVTGSAGLIGSQIVKIWYNKITQFTPVIMIKNPFKEFQLLLIFQMKIKSYKPLQQIKPDRIIHLAAMTGVDLCETEKELATIINTKATETLAKQAANKVLFFFMFQLIMSLMGLMV